MTRARARRARLFAAHPRASRGADRGRLSVSDQANTPGTVGETENGAQAPLTLEDRARAPSSRRWRRCPGTPVPRPSSGGVRAAAPGDSSLHLPLRCTPTSVTTRPRWSPISRASREPSLMLAVRKRLTAPAAATATTSPTTTRSIPRSHAEDFELVEYAAQQRHGTHPAGAQPRGVMARPTRGGSTWWRRATPRSGLLRIEWPRPTRRRHEGLIPVLEIEYGDGARPARDLVRCVGVSSVRGIVSVHEHRLTVDRREYPRISGATA